MLSNRIRNRKGFTLVELLVVVLILAILMAVALPLYLNSVKDSSKKTCRANMQSIANAAQAWKVATRASDFSGLSGDSSTWLSKLSGDLGSSPTCPDGGTYTILANSGTADGHTLVAGEMAVSCSFGSGGDAHGAYVPGVSSK